MILAELLQKHKDGVKPVPIKEPKRKNVKLVEKKIDIVSMDVNVDVSVADQAFIIIPDIHSYEKDDAAYELCMEALPILNAKYNVTKVIQLGDLLECGEFSMHGKSHVHEEVPSYEAEIEWAMDNFWTRVKSSCPSAKLHALLGNHEFRANKWILANMNKKSFAKHLYDNVMPTELYESLGIHVTQYGNENVNDGVLEIFPGLVCVHGWSFATNAAKAHYDRLMGSMSVIFGHTHRTQSMIKAHPVTGDLVGAWSFGALAKKNMFYNRGLPTDHTFGFGLVTTHGNKFTVQTIPIHGDTHKTCILPDGTVLSSK